MRFFLFLILFFGFLASSQAKLNVITTTTTLRALVEELGQNQVSVDSLTRSTQDPHFVEAKPSYMVKLRDADLLVAVGLDLEVGWLGLLQRGAKNPQLLAGQKGFFEAGNHIEPLGKTKGKIDRSKGDVHPEGNPHFHLDPLRMIKVAKALADRLGKLDKPNEEFYIDQAEKFAKKIRARMLEWQRRVDLSGIKTVVTYHKSFNYFLDRFSIKPVAYIEPKPGVPPTARHVIDLIQRAKKNKFSCILNESYFEQTAAKRIQKESGAVIQVVPVEAKDDYFSLIESLVEAVENCAKESF